MCLAVPGRIIEVTRRAGFEEALVDFQGTRGRVGLALVPEAGPGDWVLVHAGFAIAPLEREAALETWEYLRESGMAGDVFGEEAAQDTAGGGRP